MTELAQEALEVLARVPPDRAATVDELAGDRTRPATLRQMRNLLAHGLVKPEKRRPLTVSLAHDRFTRAVHGLLGERSFLAPVLAGNHLRVLAALHAHPGSSVAALARATGLHGNTVRNILAQLMSRALIGRQGEGLAVASHAGAIRDLASFYIDHEHRRKLPRADAVIRQGGPLVLVVETKAPQALPSTAVKRFEEAGADVLASRYQYRIHALNDRQDVELAEAFQDAQAIGTPRRTLNAMRHFMEANHG